MGRTQAIFWVGPGLPYLIDPRFAILEPRPNGRARESFCLASFALLRYFKRAVPCPNHARILPSKSSKLGDSASVANSPVSSMTAQSPPLAISALSEVACTGHETVPPAVGPRGWVSAAGSVGRRQLERHVTL